MKFRIVVLIALAISSCQTRIVPVSKRHYISKPVGVKIMKKGRDIADEEQKSPNIYIKRKKLKIDPVVEINSTGSLMFLNNPENYLFTPMPKGKIGDTLVILTRVNKSEEQKPPVEGEQKPEELQDELLAALPKLAPKESEKIVPLTSIKFKIDRRLPNGDVIISSFRASSNEGESNTIRIQARLSRSDLMNKKEITTDDLLDVEWYERQDGEVFERQSLSWQDEYTMRLSGFNEARSQYAEQLVNKEKDLVRVREKLRDRINTLGRERQAVAKARQDVDKRNKAMSQIVDGLRTKINEQEDVINEQKSIIKKQSELLESTQDDNVSAADQKEGAGG